MQDHEKQHAATLRLSALGRDSHSGFCESPRELPLLTPLLAGFAPYAIANPIACKNKIEADACWIEPKQGRAEDYTNDIDVSPAILSAMSQNDDFACAATRKMRIFATPMIAAWHARSAPAARRN